MIKSKLKTIVFSCLIFTGCSSEEYKQAEFEYLQAKSDHKIMPLVDSLTVLARLNPDEYSSSLQIATQAKAKLLAAQEYVEQKDYYAAYLSSHDSLQQLFNSASKKILLKTGVGLLPLIRAKEGIEKSYQHPLLSHSSLSDYKAMPMDDWDLIELNTTLKGLSENIYLLEESKDHIKELYRPNYESLSAELLQLEHEINNRQVDVKFVQNYLLNLALNRSAELLIRLNEKLANESITISQLFNRNKVEAAMRPFIESSQEKYAASKYIVENMYYASSVKNKKLHTAWFKKWQLLEKSILEPSTDFEYYSEQAKHRKTALMNYTNPQKISLPTTEESPPSLLAYFQKKTAIAVLVDRLVIDKRFLLAIRK